MIGSTPQSEIKRLTPNQWMNAMANQALDKPVESGHTHTLHSHQHKFNLSNLGLLFM